MTTQTAAATGIVSWIETAAGIDDLANSIARQAKAHEHDPSQPNWVTSQPGTDWHTGQPGKPIYVWSDKTLEYLRQPLRDTLRNTKNDPDLELQCWTALPGTTQLPMSIAPAVARGRGQPEANYTVKDVTPQSGVQNTFSYDPGIASATIGFKNYYVRWLQVSVDQYPPGPDEPPVGPTQALGTLSPVDTIMAVPLPPDWSDFSFTFDDRASRAVVSLGGLGQAPFDWSYDELGIICTAVFNYAAPTMFIALGVAADQGGKSWTGLCKQIATEWSKASPSVEAVAEGPLGGAVSGGVGLEDVMAMMGNLAGSLLLGAIADSSALEGYIAGALGESAAEDAEPFLGWAALAIGAAADVASMIETTAEVASSPATMVVSVERTLDVQLTVTPDPDHDNGTVWPQTATHYVISVTYDDGPVYYYDGAPLPPPGQCPDSTLGTCINHTFAGLPAGGNITVLVCLYSDTGWLAGQAKTKSLPAQPTEGSFTSMQTGGQLPPGMAGADLTGAVIPGGIPWGKTRDGVGSFAGALLANATVTGADLAGGDLSGAELSGAGVSVFSPAYESSQGINGYDLLVEADRVIAFDFDADLAHPKANYLVCYRRVRHSRQDHRRQRQRLVRPRLFSGRGWRRHRWLQPDECGRPDDRVRLRQHRQPRPSRLLPTRRRVDFGHREEDGRRRHRHVRQGMGLDERHRRQRWLQPPQSRRPDHRLRLRGHRPPRPLALLPPGNRPDLDF